jgi:dTDP-4-dehydrorhamnose reductase
MKVAILGSSGFLGNALFSQLKKRFKIYHTGLKRRKFNLNNYKLLQNFIISCNPSLIINCASLTDIDKCENKKKESYNINTKLLNSIFKIKKKLKLKFQLIHFSTDQLYDGNSNTNNNEKSKIKINNIYSLHKYLGEKICKKNKAIVFRTNFFGNNKNSFSNWICKKFKEKKKKKFFLFKDVYFSPLRVNTIAVIIKKIINKKKLVNLSETFNLGSRNGLSKHKFAILYAKKLGIYSKDKYRTGYVNEVVKVKRSKNMKMDVKKFEKYFDTKMNTLKKEIELETKKYA